MTTKTYAIKSIEDFLLVPDNKRNQCLKEFAEWLTLCKIFDGIVKTEAFNWVDDGEENIYVRFSKESKGDN